MAAPYYDIEQKLEEAMAHIVTELGIEGLDIRTGADDEDLNDVKRCICVAGVGSEILQSGNFRFESARVSVYTPFKAGDSLDDHRALVAEIRDAFTDPDVHTTMSDAVVEFSVYELGPLSVDTRTEERSFASDLTLDITAVAADV